MKEGSHNYAHVHNLVTATDDIKSLFVLTLGELVSVENSANYV